MQQKQDHSAKPAERKIKGTPSVRPQGSGHVTEGQQQAGGSAGGAWAEQQRQGLKNQRAAQSAAERHPALADDQQRNLEGQVARETEQDDPGEDRTPDKVIGQIAHADGQKVEQAGAGEPAPITLEPEKQGGIGGP